MFVGALIYLLFRPDTYISKWGKHILWLDVAGVGKAAEKWPMVSGFLRNFSCDMLWAYALTITIFWCREKEPDKRLKTILECILFEIMLEVLQYVGILSGTFDFGDIFVQAISTVIAAVVACAGMNQNDANR